MKFKYNLYFLYTLVQAMSNRDKLLKAAEQLNIPIPKGKYIKNEDLKTLIVEFVNRKKSKSVKKKENTS